MAELLRDTNFIPKTIKVTQDDPRFEEVEKEIGFPCWIRATEGTGGLGSLKLENLSSYKTWLFINNQIPALSSFCARQRNVTCRSDGRVY